MRSWCGFLAVLLLVPVALGAEVQRQIIEDSSGDVMLTTADGGNQQSDPTGFYSNVDVVSAGVWAEDDNGITFYLTLGDLTESSQVPLPFSDPDYYLYFRFGDQGYRVFVATALDNPTNAAFGREGVAFARLERQVDAFRYQGLTEVEVELDFGENIAKFTVPRDAVRDHNEAPLARNATLRDIFVESKSMGWFSFPIGTGNGGVQVGIPQALDRAPDEGTASYTMTTGTFQQVGNLFAVSEDPVRWTNGEATTLTFTTTVTNLGGDNLDTTISVAGSGAGWELAHSDQVTVPARGSVQVPVLVSIPFGHQHGVTHLFSTVFESLNGDHKATAVLGVHWPAVPQPAGHHDRLWFHTAPTEMPEPFNSIFGGVHGWFNAKEEVETDTSVMMPAMFAQVPGFFGSQEGFAYWSLRLEPGLRMGIDFEPTREGLIELGFNLPLPVVDPTVEVVLRQTTSGGEDVNSQGNGTRRGFERTVDLMGGASETNTGTFSGALDVDVPFHVLDGIDDVAYDPEANLEMVVIMRATFLFGGTFANQAAWTPSINPTTSGMQLPLNEYSDPTDLSFRTDASIGIVVGDQGQERYVNPGRTIIYTFELDYTGAQAATFDATLSGKNAGWGTIVGDLRFDLGPSMKRTLAVAVTAPEDAREAEQADLTLRIVHKDNSAIQAGIGMLTTVTTSQDIPDESDQLAALSGELTSDKDSPGLGIIALLALIVLARRR